MASGNPYRVDDPRWAEWERRSTRPLADSEIVWLRDYLQPVREHLTFEEILRSRAAMIPAHKPLTVRDAIVAVTVTLAMAVLLIGGALWVTP